MGFSSALQGRAAHEALVVRQDAELRLMETMKRTILAKAKCDKEYAVSLAAVAQQGLKVDRSDELQGSLITKSWRTYMDEIDHQAKQLKTNAELLETACEKLSHLSQDKRRARKAYQEEHSKIAARLNHLIEEVVRKKSEYQKHLEGYKGLRTRFEEHYIKSGRGGRKLDDVRDKYQKACRKLHLTHNEYVLAISEAVEVERDFRTVLLPGLLEHQQSVQESFILLWKKILQEILQNSDPTSEKFMEIQKRIETAVNNINPAEEYREFTEKNKTSPATPVLFQFDETLIEDTPGKLQSNSLTVDNLTVDWLRSRLNELETAVKECQERQEKMVGDLNGPLHTNGSNGLASKENQKQSKDLNSVRCQEKQKQRLADMIRNALNEVGCEELPSGCDDLSVEQNFIENNFANDQTTSATTTNNTITTSSFLHRGAANVFSTIRAPFKRKSTTPQSPKSNKPRGSQLRSADSVGSLSVNSTLSSSRSSVNVEVPSTSPPEPPIAETIETIHEYIPDDDNIYSELDLSAAAAAVTIASATNANPENTNQTDLTIPEVPPFPNASKIIIVDINIDEPVTPKATLSPSVDVKSSIDAHLDKIDEINKCMDDKLKISAPNDQRSETDIGLEVSSEDKTLERDELRFGFKEKLLNKIPWKKNLDITPSPTKNPNGIQFAESIETQTFEQNPETNSSSADYSDSKIDHVDNEPDPSLGLDLNHKRSTSFSNRSFNAIFNSFKERNFSSIRVNSTHKQHQTKASLTPDKEIDEILHNVAEISEQELFNDLINVKLTSQQTVKKDAKNASKRLKREKKAQKEKDKSNKSNKNAIRTRLGIFQRQKSNICSDCSKKRKINPSKEVLDFAKEFHSDEIFDPDFCTCDFIENTNNVPSKEINCELKLADGNITDNSNASSNDDVLCVKEHTYCEPFGISFSTSRPLYEEEWFHGVLPREEVVRLLKIEGDFLVRETLRNEESQIVLSVCWNGHKHFIVQTTVDGHYRFEGPPFPSIQELIMHQYQSESPVTGKSGAILRKPVMRERWELSNDDVILLEKIGRGNFGDVYKAKLKSTKLDVAVKTCRMALPDEQKRKFLQEGRILKQYDHPNIVKLIGICVQKQPIMIVMELVPGGSLLNYLRKNSNTLNTRQLMGMCRDAAAGMRYLESKNCIHRDLAARNCLIDFENSVKISDFGMSREEEEYIVSDGMKQIPVKWTAPEALNFGKYTTLCDVWSYGILMWEIFSKGDTPYSGMSNSRARERIDTGYRMPAPENTSAEMYRLMLKCWAAEPESRPHFDEIFTIVDALILRESG